MLDEEEMQMIYNWVDEIPLSRPKRNIARDFSDGGNEFFHDQHMFQIKEHFYFDFITLLCSTDGRSSKALHPSYRRDPQLFRSTFSIAENLQLEHFKSESIQEVRFHSGEERCRRCC